MTHGVARLRRALARSRRGTIKRAALTLSLASVLALVTTLLTTHERTQQRRARLTSAVQQLDSLTDGSPADDARRAAIAWGYAERMRLGLESPFRLIETAAHDSRLTSDERHTVSWALLAHVIAGQSHQVEPAALDLIGPTVRGTPVPGEQHLALIGDVIRRADDPRAAELAIRLAYTLGATERLVDASAPGIVAEAAALIADGEIARREGIEIVRSARDRDPIDEIRRRRARRAIYVERPMLFAPEPHIERDAVALIPALRNALRSMAMPAPQVDTAVDSATTRDARLADELLIAGAQLPPASPLVVTVQRFLPVVRSAAPGVDAAALRRALNGEMLVAVTTRADSTRRHRRVIGRLLLSAGVAMRTLGQEPVWFATTTDSTLTPSRITAAIGVSAIAFDSDVPAAWRPYLLRSLAEGVRDLRRVLPSLTLTSVQVRFRMTPPADSALAMHDPRSRTLHLPASTAGGTLLHELAHELDRQSAIAAGVPGYRSDAEMRVDVRKPARPGAQSGSGSRVAASLRALTEEITSVARSPKANDRPAEIFATRVDWFVAQALARDGITNGFLTGVQDEVLTGHVVHPERLRSAGRSLSLIDALDGMTTIAPRARKVSEVSLETLLRWSLAGPVDREVAATIVGGKAGWAAPVALSTASDACDGGGSGRAALVRMAAESRARGWLRQRARWQSEEQRPAWARATLGEAPWDESSVDQRVAELRDHALLQLSSAAELPAGLSAYAARLADQARCQ